MKITLSIITAFLLLASAHASLGQALPLPADTARSYRHHLGLTASPQLAQFFTANRALPIGLIYRQQTRHNRAWRARLVGRYDFNSGDAPLLVGNAYREHTGSLELAWGRERWLPLGRRVTAYAGGEVGARLDVYRKNSEYYRALPRYTPVYSPLEKAVTDQKESRNTQAVFIQAVAGVRFKISQRMFAEAEAGLPVSFSHQKWSLYGVEYFVADREPSGADVRVDNTYYSISAKLLPVSRLHLVLLF